MPLTRIFVFVCNNVFFALVVLSNRYYTSFKIKCAYNIFFVLGSSVEVCESCENNLIQ